MRIRWLFAAALLVPTTALAQPFGGFEVALHGRAEVDRGRANLMHGRAFEVRGVARLRPLTSGQIRARWVGETPDAPTAPWSDVRADRDGHFQVSVETPARASNPSHIEVEIGDGERSRRVRVPVRVVATEEIQLKTDRRFYEPGEPIHVWALVRDRHTGAPLPGRRLQISVSRSPMFEATVETTESGVAHARFELSPREPTATLHVVAELDEDLQETTAVDVGLRTQERMMVDLEWSETQVPPSGTFHPVVKVTAPSGAPVRNAAVVLTVEGGASLTGRTNDDGEARFDARAPAFLPNETGLVSVSASARHAAQGTAETRRQLRLAAPLALAVEAMARGGALVPDVQSSLYVHVTDAAGDPPNAGTVVKVRGPGLRRPAELRTDEHGFVEVDVRIARSDAARHVQGNCARRAAASFDVEIEGPRPRQARVCVPVDVNAVVRPVVDRAVASPGESLRVTLRRRPSARRNAVVVSLMNGDQPLAVQVTRGDALRFELPRVLGLLHVRARAVGDPARDSSAASAAAVEPVLVRPAQPAFPSAQPVAPVYPVGGTAEVDVSTVAGAPRGWLAMDVRDLAQHGGEVPFHARFLRGQIRKALLDPSTPSLTRLARAVLATRVQTPPPPPEIDPRIDEWGHSVSRSWSEPSEMDLRDPVAAGLEMVRRGLGTSLLMIEQAVAQADDVEELTEGSGARRRLRDDLPRHLDMSDETLGGLPLTVAALRDADPSFGFQAIGRRVARERLVHALIAVSEMLRETEDAAPPPDRWISTLVREGRLATRDATDPWGGALGVRRRPTNGLSISPDDPDWTLAFPGPDGRVGTNDDIVDPFRRAVTAGSLYAIASGEDELMRALALVSPGQAALAAMIEAYQRMTRAQMEAQQGDAVSADATEGMLVGDQIGESFGFGGLGMIGTGGGGGGSGYGRGAGGLRGRSSRVPRIRTGMASVRGSGSLRGLVREEFPGTLRFEPSIDVSESGTTRVAIPLAHAATTYLVEFVHWREDGWIWSTKTEIRVDQDLVVDAPVPRFATEGDELLLPLRAANRSGQPMQVSLSVTAEGELPVEVPEAAGVDVPPGDARVHLARIRAREGSGHLLVAGRSANVDDATRRPLQVLANARSTTLDADTWLAGPGELVLEVPAEAKRRRGGALVITTGHAMFGDSSGSWGAWGRALRGRATADDIDAATEWIAARRNEDGGFALREPVQMARALAIAYRNERALPDADVDALLLALTEHVAEGEPSLGVTERSALFLLALAPALRHAGERRGGESLRQLATTLQATVESGAATHSDAPALQAAAAAALAWARADRARVQEHVRRAERGVVRFADEVWLQGRSGELRSQNLGPSALLALAYIARRDREAAFELIRTLARRAERGGGAAMALAGAAAGLLTTQPLERVTLEIDGARRVIDLDRGNARVELAEWDRPGRHVVKIVSLPDGHALHLAATASIAMPWRTTEQGPAGVVVTLERTSDGEARVDRYDEWELEIRNRRPRTARETIVEVTLPSGAELDEQAMTHLHARLHGRPARNQQTLRLRLRALLPGRSIRLPLRLRMTVAGRLRGLGVAAHPADRPRDVTVLAPRVVEVSQ